MGLMYAPSDNDQFAASKTLLATIGTLSDVKAQRDTTRLQEQELGIKTKALGLEERKVSLDERESSVRQKYLQSQSLYMDAMTGDLENKLRIDYDKQMLELNRQATVARAANDKASASELAERANMLKAQLSALDGMPQEEKRQMLWSTEITKGLQAQNYAANQENNALKTMMQYTEMQMQGLFRQNEQREQQIRTAISAAAEMDPSLIGEYTAAFISGDNTKLAEIAGKNEAKKMQRKAQESQQKITESQVDKPAGGGEKMSLDELIEAQGIQMGPETKAVYANAYLQGASVQNLDIRVVSVPDGHELRTRKLMGMDWLKKDKPGLMALTQQEAKKYKLEKEWSEATSVWGSSNSNQQTDVLGILK